MPASHKTAQYIRLDERNHVEKPFLDLLDGLGWTVLVCDNRETPARSGVASDPEVGLIKNGKSACDR